MRLLLAFGESEGQLHFLILECNHTHTHTHMHTHTHTPLMNEQRIGDVTPATKGDPALNRYHTSTYQQICIAQTILRKYTPIHSHRK